MKQLKVEILSLEVNLPGTVSEFRMLMNSRPRSENFSLPTPPYRFIDGSTNDKKLCQNMNSSKWKFFLSVINVNLPGTIFGLKESTLRIILERVDSFPE